MNKGKDKVMQILLAENHQWISTTSGSILSYLDFKVYKIYSDCER